MAANNDDDAETSDEDDCEFADMLERRGKRGAAGTMVVVAYDALLLSARGGATERRDGADDEDADEDKVDIVEVDDADNDADCGTAEGTDG